MMNTTRDSVGSLENVGKKQKLPPPPQSSNQAVSTVNALGLFPYNTLSAPPHIGHRVTFVILHLAILFLLTLMTNYFFRDIVTVCKHINWLYHSSLCERTMI